MIWVFLGGVAVGVFGMFVLWLWLSWRDEMAVLRMVKGEDEDQL